MQLQIILIVSLKKLPNLITWQQKVTYESIVHIKGLAIVEQLLKGLSLGAFEHLSVLRRLVMKYAGSLITFNDVVSLLIFKLTGYYKLLI